MIRSNDRNSNWRRIIFDALVMRNELILSAFEDYCQHQIVDDLSITNGWSRETKAQVTFDMWDRVTHIMNTVIRLIVVRPID